MNDCKAYQRVGEEIVLSIDLISFSNVCIYKDGDFIMVPSAEGYSVDGESFPNFVAFTEDGEILVGEPAKRQYENNEEGTIWGIHRFLGTDHKVNIRGKEYTPEEITAIVLEKIKKDSEEFLGEKIDNVIIAVPTNFNDNQRDAAKKSAFLAGFNDIKIIGRSIAASLAYGLNKVTDEKISVLVFDLGGGTLDVTIVEIKDNNFDLVSTSGNNYIGENDMDDLLSRYLANEFEKEHGINLLLDKKAELIRASKKAKIELITNEKTQINLPFIALDSDNNPLNLEIKLNKAQYDSLMMPLVKMSCETIQEALDGACLTRKDIDKVISVSKGTRIPIVQKVVEDFLGKPFERGINPEGCVIRGAALFGEIIEENFKILKL